MSESELALVPTQDLIKEITSRTTFAGLMLFSPDDHKFNYQSHDQFHLHTTISVEDTVALLMRTAEALQQTQG